MDNAELAIAEREYLQAKRTLSFHERRDHSMSIEYERTLRERIAVTQRRFEAALDAHHAEKETHRGHPEPVVTCPLCIAALAGDIVYRKGNR